MQPVFFGGEGGEEYSINDPEPEPDLDVNFESRFFEFEGEDVNESGCFKAGSGSGSGSEKTLFASSLEKSEAYPVPVLE